MPKPIQYSRDSLNESNAFENIDFTKNIFHFVR